MRQGPVAGALAGLGAGFVFGVMLQMLSAPMPAGGSVPMIVMVAGILRSDSVIVGWLYHLINSVVIGGIFAWFLGERIGNKFARGAGWGVAYGFVWWVMGGLVLMPLMLGMAAFSPLRTMPVAAFGSLLGHALFGYVLGVGLAWLQRPSQADALGRVQTA